MPRSLDPSSRLTLVLACDVDKPRESQPRIFARTLTINQQRKLLSSMSQMQSAGDSNSQLDAALDAAEACLVGWENMIDPTTGTVIEFSRESIGDVLSIDELAEIFNTVNSASTASPDDKKKLDSQP